MPRPSVTVYSKPACPACTATKRKLTALDVPFDAAEIADHPEILDLAAEHGITAAPVVVVKDWTSDRAYDLHVFGGFDPDRLEGLAA